MSGMLYRPALFCCAALIISVFSGCAPRFPKPELSGTELSAQDSTNFLSAAAANEGDLTSLRALANVELHSGDDVGSFRYALVYLAPYRLRIETLPINAAYTLGMLVAQGESYTFLDTTEKRASSGDATPDEIESVIGIPLSPWELLPLLLARGAHAIQNMNLQPQCYRDEAINQAVCATEDGSRYYIFSLSPLRLSSFELRYPSGKLRLRLHYQWSGDKPNALSAVHALLPKHDIHVDLEYRVIKSNVEVPVQLFDVQIPSDYDRR